MTGNLQARARRRLALMPDAGAWGCLSLAVALAGPAAVQAQSLPVVSHPVVQPLPGEGQAAAPAPRQRSAAGLHASPVVHRVAWTGQAPPRRQEAPPTPHAGAGAMPSDAALPR